MTARETQIEVADDVVVIDLVLKKMQVGDLDVMFAESFARYLLEEHPEAREVWITEDLALKLLVENSAARGRLGERALVPQLRANPYVQQVEINRLRDVLRREVSTRLVQTPEVISPVRDS